jgi:hypothetical protein
LRNKELRKPIAKAPDAARCFHRVIADVVARVCSFFPETIPGSHSGVQCENLSNETGCWLYFAAQHPTASSPFVHYSSPRIRRDAKPQLIEIQQQFLKIFSALQTSRRHEAMELAVELAQAQEQHKEAAAEVEQVRNALAEERAKIVAQEALIARLQAIANSA